MNAKPKPQQQGTWNSPEAIAKHRAMTPGERFKLAAELSRAARMFAAESPKDLIDLTELEAIHGPAEPA